MPLSNLTLFSGCLALSFLLPAMPSDAASAPCAIPAVTAGGALFEDKTLSRDGTVSCETCHDPAHAYADAQPRAVGVDGLISTRNAPSLLGIGEDSMFFWDGRRTRLEDAVVDPYTNPREFALPSQDALLARVRTKSHLMKALQAAFPHSRDVPTMPQVSVALACFVRGLRKTSVADADKGKPAAANEVDQGRQLFEGLAGCSECHRVDGGRYTDNGFHHSGVSQEPLLGTLTELAKQISDHPLKPEEIGPLVLADPAWSALGRFVVTRRPADIGAFRTPSLRNVALTAPYMHDGSIATLEEAVNREIYYRAFSSGRTVNLSQRERNAIVAFLGIL